METGHPPKSDTPKRHLNAVGVEVRGCAISGCRKVAYPNQATCKEHTGAVACIATGCDRLTMAGPCGRCRARVDAPPIPKRPPADEDVMA